MNRDEAYIFLNSQIKNPNLIKHHLAAEASMRGLARYFKSKGLDYVNEDTWGLVGLLHDADYEETREHPEKHTLVLEEKLKDKVSPEIMYAIKCHNLHNIKILPKSIMDWSIYCCDELTGLIIASALIHPDKKLNFITTDFVLNRFNENSFAKGANREQIKACEEKLGIPLKEFIELNLKAIQLIASDLEL